MTDRPRAGSNAAAGPRVSPAPADPGPTTSDRTARPGVTSEPGDLELAPPSAELVGPDFEQTARTGVRRHPERASYDRALVESVLDEAMICHVGFVADGHPYVIPTIHARRGDTLYLHGSPASRMLRTLRSGVEVCVTVTLVDGLVLARSVFSHSLNYRSVVILGVATEVTDAGRSREARAPSPTELRTTLVLALPLEEVSAKVRTGPPGDGDDDLQRPIWAGVLPLRTVPGETVDDPRLAGAHPGLRPSSVVTEWRRPG
jgi:nitroimidazol reductase NimA-like FMN-containing flavoprotein (pyridoxamine 5'-phosphate oxidase superfamily)